MCNPGLSTSWYSDAKKLGIEIPKGIIKNPFIENTDFSKLKFIKLLGGEPLMEQKVIKKILKQCDLSQLHIQLITNGTVIPDDELKGMLEQVKRLEVKLSIDAYGKLNDFLRSGSKWEQVEKTVDWFKGFVNKKFLSIHSVASIYNINKLDEMVEYAKSKEIYHEYVPLDDVDYMQTKHLPLEAKKLLVEQIASKNYKFGVSLIYELEQHGDINVFLEQDTIMNSLRIEHWKEINPELLNLTRM
jgi:sulfatase maturation enzyme AslB (radical SAM superfamily)|tara:strand:+ start:31 stop:762 length:732 start_codon:yes stop_codon:yes gene_type:complete